MAKTAAAKSTGPKESSQPLVISLVFFVLLTIGLGVFCYTLYSAQADKDAAVAKEKADGNNIRGLKDEAELTAKAYRVYLGVGSPEDLSAVAGMKDGDKPAQAVAKLAADVKAQAGSAGKAAAEAFGRSSKLDLKDLAPDGLGGWADEALAGGVKSAGGGLVQAAAKQEVLRNLALRQAAADQAGYNDARTKMAEVAGGYEKATKELEAVAKRLPEEYRGRVEEIAKQFDERGKTYQTNETAARKEIEKGVADYDALKFEKQRVELDLKDARTNLDIQKLKDKPADPLQHDEPQGEITRRLPDNMVEINIGSTARVTEGLVFTVLPSDFREKGRQSRMLNFRESDGRGGIRTVQRFTPKATLEVVDVLGPNLSRARITSQHDQTRDAVLQGDLLYNAVWRRGQADHVALVGIFDTNGDGTDDVEAVVKDLTRMGVTVDAYYDLRTLKWKGSLGERTRYVVQGYTPTGSGVEANREARTRLIGGIAAAKKDATDKSIAVVDFRDFFGRMGYQARGDVSEDRVNMAATRYYAGAGAVEAPKERD